MINFVLLKNLLHILISYKMRNWICFLIFSMLLVIIITTFAVVRIRESLPRNRKFKGLILFDIDGTLTTGTENDKVVDMCIKKGYAVGICTAGSMYKMENLKSFRWMPHNLWNFIREHDDITFNNVASNIIAGKLDPIVYSKLGIIDKTNNLGIILGIRKGFALKYTGNKLGITNSKKLLLCDDDSFFIKGINNYDSDLITICSGANCGGHLTVENVAYYL